MLKIHAIRHSSQFFIVLFVLLTLLLVGTWYTATASATDKLRQQAEDFLAVFASDLSAEVDKFKTIPLLLAHHPTLIAAASNPSDAAVIRTTNELLKNFNTISRSNDTYVLDANGKTVAASNWNTAESFIGEDLSFRPYYKDAMQRGTGYYFALGDTSRRRGYYFSSAIVKDKAPVGVIVVKVDMDLLEHTWSRGKEPILVSDEDGVIFISTKHDWDYKTIARIPAPRLEQIKTSRRYADMPLLPLKFKRKTVNPGGDQQWKLYDEKSASTLNLLQQSIEVPEKGWVIHTLSDLKTVNEHALHRVLFVFLLTSLGIAVLGIALTQQRNRLQQSNLRRATYGVMEEQVAKRTKQLSAANKRLQREITERRQAEKDLTAAQENLVQAAKMAALGKMATSLTHELSQPLAAIRAFADNTQEFIRRQELAHADKNLGLIIKMGNRMREIMQNLKTFARKTPLQVENVALGFVIQQTLEMMNPALQRAAVDIHYEPLAADIQVRAEPVRLQQVFTNLLHNAIDAVRDSEQRDIVISSLLEEGSIAVSVTDSGTGIDSGIRKKLFEPFSTTKKSGEGLGLGLSLSRSIVQEFGGQLSATDAQTRGAVFTVRLKRAHHPAGTPHENQPVAGQPSAQDRPGVSA